MRRSLSRGRERMISVVLLFLAVLTLLLQRAASQDGMLNNPYKKSNGIHSQSRLLQNATASSSVLPTESLLTTSTSTTVATSATRNAEDDYEHFEHPQYALLYPWFVQVIGVVIFFALNHYEIPIPYAAVMFTAGMIMGIAAFRLNDPLTVQLHDSILQWSDIDSQLLLLVFLPGLIFRDAIEINIPVFMKCFGQLLILAFPCVLVGTVLTGAAVVYVLPLDDTTRDYFNWPLGLTMGAILASTDPVAVASVLKAADAPPRLQMLLGGESMLNDAAAVVFYTIFSRQFFAELDLASGSMVSIGEGIAIFVRMSLGGVAVGLAFAILLLILLFELDRRLDREFNVLQVAAAISIAYLSYYTSEQLLGMSGVVSCVTCGLVARALGKGLITDPGLMDAYLKLVEHLLNTLLFTLGGTVFGEIIANSDQRAHFTWTEWNSLFVLYIMVMVIRGIQVVLFYPLISRLGLKTNWQESVFFSFAGLRGAVGIALALSLDRTVREDTLDEGSRAISSTVVGLTGGVSFLTLIINGSLAGWLLQKLNLTPPVTSRKRALRLFEKTARDFIIHSFMKLRRDQPCFSAVDFAYVQHHLPFLTGVTRNCVTCIDSTTTSKFFRQRSSQYDTDDDTENDDEMGIASPRLVRPSELSGTIRNTSCPNEIKTDIREIFLKILDAIYMAELSRGGLDAREDNGFNVEVLHQSVRFAVDDCHSCKEAPLHDWEYTNMFTFHESAQDYIRRLLRRTGHKYFIRTPRCNKVNKTKGSTLEFLKLRIGVLRALVFIESHRRAEIELRSYLETMDGVPSSSSFFSEGSISLEHLESGIYSVLEESKDQVQQARDWLAKIPEEDLDCIQSHYMVTMLLHKLGLYVEKAVGQGKLKEKEGQLYLVQIDKRIQNVQRCCHRHGTTSISTDEESN